MKKLSIIIGTIVIAVGLCCIFPLLFLAEKENIDNPAKIVNEKETAISLEFSAVGDVMVHRPQIPAQYDEATGTYNFDNNFEYIKKYIENTDLALCNLETTFAGGTYTGYPVFNAPETLAGALKKAGFDVAFTANNHIMDMGLSGMKRTLEITRAAGLQTAGTQLEGEENYAIVDVKGVKVGIVAYFYETPQVDGIATINGNHVNDEAWVLLNTFSYSDLDADILKIQDTMKAAESNGAEIVICYFHWGEEYQREPNDYQKKIAQAVVNSGADIVFASHPHVLQGTEIITNKATGQNVPVFYSMGNLISNQRLETLDNRYTEQGMIAKVKMEYLKSKGELSNVSIEVIPTWVDKYQSNGKDVYTVVPLDESLSENPALAKSGHLQRANQALADIKTLLNGEV